jgi:hypothetical protein
MGEEPKKGGADPKPVVFKLVSFDDLTAPSADEYNVKGLFPRRGLVLVWGPPKCGKSFWTFDLVMHVALGREYRGHKVKQGEVAYLALEGQAGFAKRRDAFRKSFLESDQKVPLFKLCGATLDLIKDHKKLIVDIKEQSAKPAIVVIDTLNRSLVGSESSDEDMAAYLKAANAIEAAFACLVVVIHHCGVNESRPRGHSSMTGAADVQIKVTKDDDGVISAVLELAKDLEEGATFPSRLKVMHLGDDPDGDRITSCVIDGVDGDAAPITNEKRKKLSPAAVTACGPSSRQPTRSTPFRRYRITFRARFAASPKSSGGTTPTGWASAPRAARRPGRRRRQPSCSGKPSGRPLVGLRTASSQPDRFPPGEICTGASRVKP